MNAELDESQNSMLREKTRGGKRDCMLGDAIYRKFRAMYIHLQGQKGISGSRKMAGGG